MMQVDTCAHIRDLLHAFWASDWETLMPWFAEDAVYEDPLLPEPVRGRDEIQRVLAYCHHWAAFHNEIRTVFGSERMVAAELRIAGRVTAAIDELPPDAVGKPFSFAEVDVIELDENGLVTRMSIYADTMSFMQQVGGWGR